jgi:hypothetical protein
MGMFEKVIGKIVEGLCEVFPKDKVIEGVDKAIDKIENAVEKTPNKIDDIIVLPVLKKVRDTFNIPDNDENQGDTPAENN